MDKHNECVKGFVHLSEAYYGAANLPRGKVVDEVTFGYYHPDGGTTGEMSMVWHLLSSSSLPAAKLECFEDAFDALSRFDNLINELGKCDGDNIQPKEFCKLLIKCGFVDNTDRKSPKSEENIESVDSADGKKAKVSLPQEREHNTTNSAIVLAKKFLDSNPYDVDTRVVVHDFVKFVREQQH